MREIAFKNFFFRIVVFFEIKTFFSMLFLINSVEIFMYLFMYLFYSLIQNYFLSILFPFLLSIIYFKYVAK